MIDEKDELMRILYGYFIQLKTNFEIKLFLSYIAYFFYWLFGQVDEAVVSLFILIILDWVLGVSAAYRENKISSKKMRSGVVKLILYFTLIITANLVDKVFYITLDQIFIPYRHTFRYLVISYLAITEALSVLEHLSEYDTPIPKSLLCKLKDYQKYKKGGEDDEEGE